MAERWNRDEEKRPNNKIYVNNLSYATSEEDLRKTFDKFGEIKKVDIRRKDVQTFAFIEYGSEAEAKAAIDAMNGQTIMGHHEIKVEFAKGEKRGPGGFGSYGGYDGGGRGGFNRDRPPMDRGAGYASGPRPGGFSGPRKCYNCDGEGHIARDCPEPHKPREYNASRAPRFDDRRNFGRGHDEERFGRDNDRDGGRDEDRGGRDRDRRHRKRSKSSSGSRNKDHRYKRRGSSSKSNS